LITHRIDKGKGSRLLYSSLSLQQRDRGGVKYGRMAYVSLCKALYDYTATAEDELSFTEDALLYVVEADDPEWWKAKLKTGEDEDDDDEDDDTAPIGLIPANYVEEAEPVRASRALYDYNKQNDDELELQEDEMLSIYAVKGDWLLAKKQDNGVPTGKLGFVPANYVDEVGRKLNFDYD
jgi:hypothetical protein